MWNSDGAVATFSDERNMTVTKFWDGLHRLTGLGYPDATTTINLYVQGGTAILDLTATKDRLGNWMYFNYDSLRRKIGETSEGGFIPNLA